MREIRFAKPVLRCGKTESATITSELVKNFAVCSKIQKLLSVHAIINAGITARKTEAVPNTSPFLMITDLQSTVILLNLSLFTVSEQNAKDTIQDSSQPGRKGFGFVIKILLKI